MKIDPAHAAALLEANFANLCAKLTAGGTLTKPERELLEKHARAAVEPPAPPAPAPDPAPALLELEPPAPASPILAPAPATIQQSFTAAEINTLAARYGATRVSLYRWLRVGKAKSDLCPLTDPVALRAWWGRCMTHRVPEAILAAAAAAPATSPGSMGNPIDAPPASSAPPPPASSAIPTDLAATAVVAGEAVEQARKIVGVWFAKLEAALAATPPDVDAAQLYQVRWEKAVETLRRQESAARLAAKESGDFVPRAAVLAEIGQLVEALRLAHASMPAKIIAELERRAPRPVRRVLRVIKPALLEATDHVRAKEAEMFSTVDSLRSPGAAREVLELRAA